MRPFNIRHTFISDDRSDNAVGKTKKLAEIIFWFYVGLSMFTGDCSRTVASIFMDALALRDKAKGSCLRLYRCHKDSAPG